MLYISDGATSFSESNNGRYCLIVFTVYNKGQNKLYLFLLFICKNILVQVWKMMLHERKRTFVLAFHCLCDGCCCCCCCRNGLQDWNVALQYFKTIFCFRLECAVSKPSKNLEDLGSKKPLWIFQMEWKLCHSYLFYIQLKTWNASKNIIFCSW